MDSALGHSDDISMYFEVKTAGFSGEQGLVSRTASAVGKVRIDFELDCDGPCIFVMYEVILCLMEFYLHHISNKYVCQSRDYWYPRKFYMRRCLG